MTDRVNYLDLKRYRKAIGADLAQMAAILELASCDATSLRRMENGVEPIPESALRILKAKLAIWRIEQKAGPTPSFIIGSNMGAASTTRWIMHTQYPRFLAVVTDSPIDGLVCATGDGIEWLAVTQWIDQPENDPLRALNEAVDQYLFYSMHF